MADEQLKMAAVVTDGYTAPLKAFQAQLASIANARHGQSVTRDWQGVASVIPRITNDIRTGLAPALSLIGVASMGVTGGLASIGLGIKNLAFSTNDMSIFSRQIGMTTTQLKEFKALGERFGMGWEQSQGALKSFAGNMDQLQKRWGDAYHKLRSMDLAELAECLVSAPNMQAAMEKARDALKAIDNPVRRREVAQLLFGTDQLATVFREATPAVIAEIKKLTSATNTEMEAAAEKFAGNWFKMEKSIERFTVNALGPAIEPLNNLIATLEKPVGAGIEKTLKGMERPCRSSRRMA